MALSGSPVMGRSPKDGSSVDGDANSRRIICRCLPGAAPARLILQPRDPQDLKSFHPFVDEAAADTHGAGNVG